MSKILIADNELSSVVDLEAYLSREGHQVICNAVSGRQALAMARETNPDLVLMEIKLAGEMDGITAAIKIRESMDIPIIFLTWYGDKRTLGEARWAHPAAYVVKPFEERHIKAAIAFALSDKPRKNNRIWELTRGWYVELVNGLHNTKERQACVLTPSETRIVDLIAQGLCTADIATQLKLKACTVHWHQKNIRRKMGLTGKKESLISKLTLRESI